MKYFYSHLIQIESVTAELDALDLRPEQKIHLAELIDSSLHHIILDAVLSGLSLSDKKVFLTHLRKDDHNEIWQFLNKKVDYVEEKIKRVVQDLKTELHHDLKEAGKR